MIIRTGLNGKVEYARIRVDRNDPEDPQKVTGLVLLSLKEFADPNGKYEGTSVQRIKDVENLEQIYLEDRQMKYLFSEYVGAVDDVEIVEPSKNPPTVVVEEFDLEKGTATIQVFHSGVTMLNPESKQLDKAMFFGKSKDEVRRYLLKLDHVRSIDIKFSPGWMRAVPYVADHVDVIIKEVQ